MRCYLAIGALLLVGCAPDASLNWVLEIAVGGYHVCARLNDGSVKCWGNNEFGQLGTGDNYPRGIKGPHMGDNLHAVNLGMTATAIAAGVRHTCAILNDGSVKCWGHNDGGQLGLGNTTNVGDTPSKTVANLLAVDLGTNMTTGEKMTAKAIAGAYHTCVILDDDSVKCWGWNARGQLGQGNTTNVGDTPSPTVANLPAVDLGTDLTTGKRMTARAITVGWPHTCAILNDGSVKCWGKNEAGQLGQGTNTDFGDGMGEMAMLQPVDLGTDMTGKKMTATAISAGWAHTCAILNEGSVKCWGWNAKGELGQETNTNVGEEMGEMAKLQPVDLGMDMTGKKMTATAISAGAEHTCAVLNDESVKCWGANNHGQLGQDSDSDIGWSSAQMGNNLPAVKLGEKAVVVAAGGYFTCTLLRDGSVKCWGANESGQLGLGDIADRGNGPGQMANLPPVDLW